MPEDVAPFVERPQCSKCLCPRASVSYAEKDRKPLLQVTCQRCGFTWAMSTADA